MTTIGISPKVKVPATVLGIIGLVLVAASYLIDGLEPVREVGVGLVVASPVGGLVGYKADPGDIAPIGPANDDLLPARPPDLP